MTVDEINLRGAIVETLLSAGETATVPIGAVHGLRNASDRAATFLVTIWSRRR